MKTLIILDMIPEETLFAVEDLTEAEYDTLSKANGYVVNVSNYEEDRSEAAVAISNGFCTNPEYIKYCETDLDRQFFGKFTHLSATDPCVQILSGVDRMIWTGWYL